MFRIIKARRRLKPCPFCGGKAKLDKNAFLPFCRCSDCGAEIRSVVYVDRAKMIHEVVEKWEKRIKEE